LPPNGYYVSTNRPRGGPETTRPDRCGRCTFPERNMKLSFITAMVLTYTVLAVVWLCYTDMSPL